VRGGPLPEFVGCFGQRDVQALLAAIDSLTEELQGDRRLARAGVALEQEGVAARQAPVQDIVEARDAGCGARSGDRALGPVRHGISLKEFRSSPGT
jgi:hypothetical protein